MRPLLRNIFAAPRPLVGMIHLPPLPDAPAPSDMRQTRDRALADAHALAGAGFDGIMVENFGDAPFQPDRVPRATVAALAVIVADVAAACPIPVGVNVLRNDADAALAVCAATGARFIRVNVHVGSMMTDQGWITGRAHETVRTRARIAPDVAILADVHVKHAAPPAGWSLEQAARDCWERGHADALIVTGAATGAQTDVDRVARVRHAAPAANVWIGSGLTPDNVALFEHAHGAIVGTTLMEDGRAGRPIDPERARRFIAAARERTDEPSQA